MSVIDVIAEKPLPKDVDSGSYLFVLNLHLYSPLLRSKYSCNSI